MTKIKVFAQVLLLAIFTLSVTSCGGFSEKAVEKMQDKFDDGDMTKDDYAKCIDWLSECWEEEENELEKLVNECKSIKKFEKACEEKEEELEEKWEGIDDIYKIVAKSSEKELGSSNLKRFEKLEEKHRKNLEKLFEKAKNKFAD